MASQGVLKEGKLYFVHPSRIVARNNPRFDFGDLSEIEASILANGYFKAKPLVVRRIQSDAHDFELRGRGGRRHQALLNLIAAGKQWPGHEEGVPVVIEDKSVTDTEALILDLIDNQQKPLLPLEEALAYKKLKDGDAEEGIKGMTIKEIAKAANRSEGHVKWTLDLLEADESVKEAVAKGEISAVLGKTIAQKAKGDKTKQKELVETAKQGKAGKKIAKEAVQQIKRRPTKAEQKEEEEKVKPLTPSQLRTRLDFVLHRVTKDLEKSGLSRAKAMTAVRVGDLDPRLAFHLGVLAALEGALGADIKFTI